MAKTDKEYLEAPNHCPFCDSDQVTGDAVEVQHLHAYQPVSCLDCGKTWEDVYQLTHYVEN